MPPSPGQKSLTLLLDPLRAPGMQGALRDAGFEISEAPHAYFRARAPGCTLTFYRKGKVVFQGAEASHWARALAPDEAEELEARPDPLEAALARHPKPPPACWAGIDETGKGDYFGPLVVVAAAVRREQVPLLQELGVTDSKKINDERIRTLAKDLRQVSLYASVVIGPERYNDLYARFRNLNDLLAWGHARALEDLLAEVPDCTWALSDRFAARDGVLRRRLMDRARAIRVDQWPRAESDPAVAVASVLARDAFVRRLARLERQIGHRLPKGAGPPVLRAGRELIAREGPEILRRVAKLHFRTTEQLGATPAEAAPKDATEE